LTEAHELATVELLGALAYGQLRSFEATARVIRIAPDARTADGVATLAMREYNSYATLRDHLATRTELPAAVMDRQKPHFDAYFDRAPLDSWFEASVFFAVGLPLAVDFCRAVAPALDEATAAAIDRAMADKAGFERDAIGQLAAQLTDEAARERARRITADLLGRALTSYQGVVTETDALKVLLAADTGDDESGEHRVKRLAVSVMGGHRRRSIELGLEHLEDVR